MMPVTPFIEEETIAGAIGDAIRIRAMRKTNTVTAVGGALLFALSPIACSSDAAKPANGTPSGASSYVESEWENYSPQFQVRLASYSGSCALRQAGSDKANSRVLRLSFQVDAGQTSVLPGTYTVGKDLVTGGAIAAFNVRDASCNKDGPDSVSGTATLTTALGVPGTAAVGSFSIDFDDGSHQSGNFDANFCDTSTVGSGSCEP
jgi:hypothetical protein